MGEAEAIIPALHHGQTHMLMTSWLGVYVSETPGCAGADSSTWLMLDQAPQPDACVRIRPEYGGQSRLSGIYNQGAPELALEVCFSSASIDLGPKLALYERAGVQEYVAVLIQEHRVEWRHLQRGRYHRLRAGSDGIVRSRVLPGLWLDPKAAINLDYARVVAVLRQGLDSPEHAEFVRLLESRKQHAAS